MFRTIFDEITRPLLVEKIVKKKAFLEKALLKGKKKDDNSSQIRVKGRGRG